MWKYLSTQASVGRATLNRCSRPNAFEPLDCSPQVVDLVLALHHAVALARVNHELGLYSAGLQALVQLVPLGRRDPLVGLPKKRSTSVSGRSSHSGLVNAPTGCQGIHFRPRRCHERGVRRDLPGRVRPTTRLPRPARRRRE